MLGELTPTEVEDVLVNGVIGRIGCLSSGRPYVVPVCYAYADGSVYGHSVEGQKLSALRDNPLVCFEVEDVRDLSNWRSVIAWGRPEELSGAEAAEGMRLLVERPRPTRAPMGRIGPPRYIGSDCKSAPDASSRRRLERTSGKATRCGEYRRVPDGQ